jgi:hypothetical protein
MSLSSSSEAMAGAAAVGLGGLADLRCAVVLSVQVNRSIDRSRSTPTHPPTHIPHSHAPQGHHRQCQAALGPAPPDSKPPPVAPSPPSNTTIKPPAQRRRRLDPQLPPRAPRPGAARSNSDALTARRMGRGGRRRRGNGGRRSPAASGDSIGDDGPLARRAGAWVWGCECVWLVLVLGGSAGDGGV